MSRSTGRHTNANNTGNSFDIDVGGMARGVVTPVWYSAPGWKATPQHFRQRLTTPPALNGCCHPGPLHIPYAATPPFIDHSHVLHESTNTPALQSVATVPTACNVVPWSQVFGATPFGAYCKVCNVKLDCGKRTLWRHMRTVTNHRHHTIPNWSAAEASLRELVGTLRQQGKPMDFISHGNKKNGFVCGGCSKTFEKKVSGIRHCQRSNGKCDVNKLVPTLLYATICGRYVGPGDLQRRLISDIVEPMDFSTTRTVLQRYIRNDEKLETYIPHFERITSRSDNFESHMLDLVELRNTVGAEDGHLERLVGKAEDWLYNNARFECSRVSGGVRAAIQVFDGNDVSEVMQNTTFNFGRHEWRLAPILEEILRFVWSHPTSTTLTRDFKLKANNMDHYFVPRLLSTLLLEPVHSSREHPLMIEFCLSLCFRSTGGGQSDITSTDTLAMRSCGQVASLYSAILFILRAGLCSYLTSVGGSNFDKKVLDLADDARKSAVANFLAPMIRQFREMQRQKPKSRMVTVCRDLTIMVDGFEFPKEIYSNIIPTVISACHGYLGVIFDGNDWKTLVDASLSVRVVKHADGNYSLSCAGVHSNDLRLVAMTSETWIAFDWLTSMLEVAFHGFGGGSMRFEEFGKLAMNHLVWHRGTFYYSSCPEKRFSMWTSAANAIMRKLPRDLALLFILWRLLCSRLGLCGLDHVAVNRAGRTASIQDAIMLLFSFSQKPDLLQIRHLWTAICNILFPSGSSSLLITASNESAVMSGHSEGTHAAMYASVVENGSEHVFERYHQGLGYKGHPVWCSDRLTFGDLEIGLRVLFGSNAKYTSVLQERMVASVALSDACHSHFGLPCGAGKSMCWILPMVAAKAVGKENRMTIAIMPYSFLTFFHHRTTSDILACCAGVDCRLVALAAGDVSADASELPGGLGDETTLPDVLFVGVHAMAHLIELHKATLRRYAANGLIGRIIFDESHLFYGELFRDSYIQMNWLGTLGVPIATMSGTLPDRLAPFLHRFLKLDNNEGSSGVQLISGGELIGDFPLGFEIRVHSGFSDLVGAVVQCFERQVLPKSRHQAVHIICASKREAAIIESTLVVADYKAALVTSDVAKDVQMELATKWHSGDFDVLVSSTCALVGNENPRCESVIIAGHLFDLPNIVQAIGRLRPGQRCPTGSVDILLPFRTNDWFQDRKMEDDCKRSTLIERGLLPADGSYFDDLFTVQSIQDWATRDHGCLLSNLSQRFGKTSKECKVCDFCRSLQITAAGKRARKDINNEAHTNVLAKPLFKMMEQRCLYCNSEICNGEGCLGAGCFKCGSPEHRSSECNFCPSRAISQRGCYYCYDLHGRSDYVPHAPRQCPMGRRLRRLIFAGYHELRMSPHTLFQDFFCKAMASPYALSTFVFEAGTQYSRGHRIEL